MCGIVGAIAKENIIPSLLNGLEKLEYRGYDSSGVAWLTETGTLERVRSVGKVAQLAEALSIKDPCAQLGIAHTRWATHGKPTEANAHPHFSHNQIAIVHNGIIENYEPLKEELITQGYQFNSQTDSEVIAHLIHQTLISSDSLLHAVQKIVPRLHGAYGTVIMDRSTPDQLIVARSGSPLVIGITPTGNYVASDQLALIHLTKTFIFLEEGDIAHLTVDKVTIYDHTGLEVNRPLHHSSLEENAGDKGTYAHYMLKEIYEQPIAIRQTLNHRFDGNTLSLQSFDDKTLDYLKRAEHVQIIACGTSYNAGMTARYWLERIAQISCDVDIASEFRYRDFIVRPNSLLITLSQSGETADTLAALRIAKEKGYMATMTICNVASSSMVREADISMMTHAGIEIGVASTKAFTTQLVNLLLISMGIAKLKNKLVDEQEHQFIEALQALPVQIEQLLTMDTQVAQLATYFREKQHCLFIGRGDYYPIAMEGALKLKELSYIHAEAYAAGELKHGPLALIDDEMPTLVIAPVNTLFSKLHSNIEEIHARGGELFIFTDQPDAFSTSPHMHPIYLPVVPEIIAPIYYTIPLQLFAYHVALTKGTDIDKPRNLAKAVTVE